MALTNNTKFRRTTITINKKINGALVSGGGFPVTASILSAFGTQSLITKDAFLALTDAAYLTRLEAFYTYLESTYSFFDRTAGINASSGTDAVLCPLDNTAAPVVSVFSSAAFMEPVSGGTIDNHMTWEIVIDQVAPYDIVYDFQVRIKDKANNLIRIQTVSGIIPTGASRHLSSTTNESIYIPESEDTFYAPLILEVVLGSENLST